MTLQQQQAAAISRVPSNIDAHLRAPSLRSLHFQNPNLNSNPNSNSNPTAPSQSSASSSATAPLSLQQQAKAAAAGGIGGGRFMGSAVGLEMAHQDAIKVCNPDVKRSFSSVEDAVLRLLPYHVVSDFEAEEDDRTLDSDTTGQIPSRLQQWDHNILAEIVEFTTIFEKQVLAMVELRGEIELREKASREAAGANLRMETDQAEQARAGAQAHTEMIARGPMRAGAVGSHAEESLAAGETSQEQGGNMGEMIYGWGDNGQRDDEAAEDFLNDENEPENGEGGEWREAGKLDLNTR